MAEDGEPTRPGAGRTPAGRCIRLRRPPLLSPVEGPFVPDVDRRALAEADRRWRVLCERNPAYFDGRSLHVLGVHRNGHGGAVLHVVDCAFRYFAVQDEAFDLGVRTLGVKAITMHDGAVLVGRRSAQVANYVGRWEFAPAGVVEPGRDPARVVVAELDEETGLAAAREPTPLAVMYDEVVRTWELVYRVVPDGRTAPADARTDEYDELEWRAPSELPDDLTPIAQRLRGFIGGEARRHGS